MCRYYTHLLLAFFFPQTWRYKLKCCSTVNCGYTSIKLVLDYHHFASPFFFHFNKKYYAIYAKSSQSADLASLCIDFLFKFAAGNINTTSVARNGQNWFEYIFWWLKINEWTKNLQIFCMKKKNYTIEPIASNSMNIFNFFSIFRFIQVEIKI